MNVCPNHCGNELDGAGECPVCGPLGRIRSRLAAGEGKRRRRRFRHEPRRARQPELLGEAVLPPSDRTG